MIDPDAALRKHSWLRTPYLNVDYVAAKLYGGPSRLHTHRLRKKIQGGSFFEPWELQQLEQIKEELFEQMRPEEQA